MQRLEQSCPSRSHRVSASDVRATWLKKKKLYVLFTHAAPLIKMLRLGAPHAGSPLGLFLALRKVDPGKGRGLGTRTAAALMPGAPAQQGHGDGLPAVHRMYNLYHPFDPVGYRSGLYPSLFFSVLHHRNQKKDKPVAFDVPCLLAQIFQSAGMSTLSLVEEQLILTQIAKECQKIGSGGRHGK